MNKLKGKAKPAVSPVKQKAQMTVLGALILVAVVIGLVQLQPKKASATSDPSAVNVPSKMAITNAGQAGSPAMAGGFVEQLIDQPITWEVSVRRDLFAWEKLEVTSPVVTAQAVNRQAIEAAARRELKLQAVMLDRSPRVLMNGKLLTQGQEIAGFTIKEVNKRSVVVSQQGVDVRINL